MLSANLPEDLMTEIMARLPVKSLLRFKCVAKSWHALITDPSFINKHLEQSYTISKNRCFKLMFQSNPYTPPSISMLSNREEPRLVQDFELPFSEKDLNLRWISVCGQCDGIFSLRLYLYRSSRSNDDEQRRLILWNPATKEVKVVPASQHQSKIKGAFDAVFGFGFDPITKDYKIVGFPNRPQEEQEQSAAVEVYNLSMNSWRTIDVVAPSFEFFSSSYMNRSYLNGAHHWLANDDYNIDKLIVSFEYSKEVFGIIELPPEANLSRFSNVLSIVDGSLAIFANYFSYALNEHHVEIWVMNEYGIESSWTKKFKIGSLTAIENILGFWGDNEILVECAGKLILYNPWNQQGRKFQIHFGTTMSLMMMVDYVESLLPLGARKEPEHPSDSRIGFGFDPITKDYKVVRLLNWPWEEEEDEDEEEEEILVEVHNLSTNSWRTMGVDIPNYVLSCPSWSSCLNGFITG
ncbi:F-box/kelch-repeat protein At3g06240-like [Neltuma alba]|uniref:F-box/kelch-repeat protein At3g06240-like n=1 Tax=Neltuma alba TaxID=207710 RepID=UPI0010A54AA4|nr:F-box/kelch-repeat protein At3g06240-like [Prosopis alba]